MSKQQLTDTEYLTKAGAQRITGRGKYAVWSECGDLTTVERFPTMAEAEAAKQRIDESGCGGRCRARRDPDAHTIEDLTLE